MTPRELVIAVPGAPGTKSENNLYLLVLKGNRWLIHSLKLQANPAYVRLVRDGRRLVIAYVAADIRSPNGSDANTVFSFSVPDSIDTSTVNPQLGPLSLLLFICNQEPASYVVWKDDGDIERLRWHEAIPNLATVLAGAA